jgi:rhamnose utilization protein RhaD (predicted bifunctional aldolase and dehydrogenase)
MLDFLTGAGLEILETITELSHEFGTTRYVRGGGGNTSCKTPQTLWVKPSGTTLADLTVQSFVALDRKKLSELYAIEPPADASAREALVKEKMEKAVLGSTPGRASVEAPLHDSLSARYVVHTHPAVANGMTCSQNGAAVCKRLFPQALWLDYIDPGYTLCMKVRQEIYRYRQANGNEPDVIFLKNHGLFVAADQPEQIRALYKEVISKLEEEYKKAGISLDLKIAPLPSALYLEEAKQTIRNALGNPQMYIVASGKFDTAPGPISPDHIVYSKSWPFIGQPTVEAIAAFKNKHGYVPQVIAFGDAVFGVASGPKAARLALELAQDGALVEKLAQAFGGIDYMTDRARQFIENWEVESYRKKQMDS